MSRIVRFHRTGGPEVLQLDELDIGRPKAGEIRIRVRALGLNRAEAMFRSGAYLEDPNLPAKLGYEAAGEIEELGEGVSGFAVGDAVSTIPAFSRPIRRVRRCRDRSGARRGQASSESILGRGGCDMDAISDGLWRASRNWWPCEGRGGRNHGGIQQCRSCGNPNRQ